MLVFASFWDLFWKHFWLVLGLAFGVLGVEKVWQNVIDNPMRQLVSTKVTSEEARLPDAIPGQCQEGGEGEDKEERKKQKRKKERRNEKRIRREARCSTRSSQWVGGFREVLSFPKSCSSFSGTRYLEPGT